MLYATDLGRYSVHILQYLSPDTTPPVITLSGSSPMNVSQGSIFTDPGASWTDAVDGSGVIMTASSGTVDTTTLDTYTLTYSYTDAAGNTGTITRIVHVIDTTLPTAAIVYSTTGSTRQDVIATLTGASEPITITNNSGSGIYTFTSNGFFTFNFVDANGNTGSTTATVFNIDRVPPMIILSGGSST
jgi:hypothetical protein